MQEGRGPGRRPRSASSPRAGANGVANGTSGHAMAEGAETALLYVRFRAAAEPGLKGGFHYHLFMSEGWLSLISLHVCLP